MKNRGHPTLDLLSNSDDQNERQESLYTQNIDENPNKLLNEENARTTTEEDIMMFSKPIYNFGHPPESSSTKYIGLTTTKENLETLCLK